MTCCGNKSSNFSMQKSVEHGKLWCCTSTFPAKRGIWSWMKIRQKKMYNIIQLKLFLDIHFYFKIFIFLRPLSPWASPRAAGCGWPGPGQRSTARRTPAWACGRSATPWVTTWRCMTGPGAGGRTHHSRGPPPPSSGCVGEARCQRWADVGMMATASICFQ